MSLHSHHSIDCAILAFCVANFGHSDCPQNIPRTHEIPIWKVYGVCRTAFCDLIPHVLLCVLAMSVPTILDIIYCVIICGLICYVF